MGIFSKLFDSLTFDEEQMKEIREGLEKGLDISIYKDARFNAK